MKYIFIFLIALLFSICLFQRRQAVLMKKAYQQKIDSIQYVVDSLHNENYPCQIELSRYEVAYQIFMKRNPKAAHQYGTIISNETE
jgi:hypothetical protein